MNNASRLSDRDHYNEDPTEHRIAVNARSGLHDAANGMSDTIRDLSGLERSAQEEIYEQLRKGVSKSGCEIKLVYPWTGGAIDITHRGNVTRYRLSGGVGKHDLYFNGQPTYATDGFGKDQGLMTIQRLNGVDIGDRNPAEIAPQQKKIRRGIFGIFGGRETEQLPTERVLLPKNVAIAEYTNTAMYMKEALENAASILRDLIAQKSAGSREASPHTAS